MTIAYNTNKSVLTIHWLTSFLTILKIINYTLTNLSKFGFCLTQPFKNSFYGVGSISFIDTFQVICCPSNVRLSTKFLCSWLDSSNVRLSTKFSYSGLDIYGRNLTQLPCNTTTYITISNIEPVVSIEMLLFNIHSYWLCSEKTNKCRAKFTSRHTSGKKKNSCKNIWWRGNIVVVLCNFCLVVYVWTRASCCIRATLVLRLLFLWDVTVKIRT